MNNKAVQDIPAAVYEFVFCSVFGWSLEYVRDISEKDFRELAPMALAKFRKDNSHD